MSKSRHVLALVLAGGAIALATSAAQAQPYPLADKVAQKVIQKYQSETCQQIAANKNAPPSDMQMKAVAMLKNDPQMRAYFINQVAGMIANKLFDCGFVP